MAQFFFGTNPTYLPPSFVTSSCKWLFLSLARPVKQITTPCKGPLRSCPTDRLRLLLKSSNASISRFLPSLNAMSRWLSVLIHSGRVNDPSWMFSRASPSPKYSSEFRILCSPPIGRYSTLQVFPRIKYRLSSSTIQIPQEVVSVSSCQKKYYTPDLSRFQ